MSLPVGWVYMSTQDDLLLELLADLLERLQEFSNHSAEREFRIPNLIFPQILSIWIGLKLSYDSSDQGWASEIKRAMIFEEGSLFGEWSLFEKRKLHTYNIFFNIKTPLNIRLKWRNKREILKGSWWLNKCKLLG